MSIIDDDNFPLNDEAQAQLDLADAEERAADAHERAIEAQEEAREDEELVDELKSRQHHHNYKKWVSLLVGVVILILIVFLALWLFSMYRRWRVDQGLNNLGQGITQALGGQSAQQLALPQNASTAPNMALPAMFPLGLGMGGMGGASSGAASSGQAVQGFSPQNTPKQGLFTSLGAPGASQMAPMAVENAQHTLLVPNSPAQGSYSAQGSAPGSPALAPQGQFVNDLNHNRVHFFYHGEKNDDSQHMYRQYKRLYETCQRKDFLSRYGLVKFHKCDLTKPEGKQYYEQLNLDGGSAQKSQVPLCTFARKGHYEEAVLGLKGSKAKQLMTSLVANLQAQKANPQ